MPDDLKNITFRGSASLMKSLAHEALNRGEALGYRVTVSMLIRDVLLKHCGLPGVLPNEKTED
jgi:hypothetical protein